MVLKHADNVFEAIMSMGELVLALIIMTLLVIPIGIAAKMGSKKLDGLKKKVCWSGFFRSQIQMYFPTTLIVLG